MLWNVTQTLLTGLGSTVQIFFLTLLFALPLGLLIAFGTMTKFTPVRWLCNTLVWIVRGTPLMLQLIGFFYIPGIIGHNIWPSGDTGRMMATVVAFSLNYACYFAVIYEGGIKAFHENEVKPYEPEIEFGEPTVGYELSFTKYFYKPVQLRSIAEISADIRKIESSTEGLLKSILG